MMRGLIYVYTCSCASGYGMRTVLVQFLKGRDTGEIHALENLRGVTVFRYAQELGFYASANETCKAEMVLQNNVNLLEASHLVHEGLCDLLVLDEICAAYTNGALDTGLADKLIYDKPFGLELVLTGRNAPQRFMDVADYVTEFVKRKHPYDSGITAREGIEF